MSKKPTYRIDGVLKVAATFTVLAMSQQASAASFALKEQSVTYLGTAFAGTSSAADPDASSSYYNPAGLTELHNSQAVISGTYIKGNMKLRNARATANLAGGVPGDFCKPRTNGLVPGMHFAWRMDERVTLGFSVVAPFGLGVRYSNADVARYMATDSKLSAVSYSPSIGYKINNQWSIGAGFDPTRVKATLAASIRFNGEGFLINEAHGWTYGYHVGLLYKPSMNTKMGLAYFSGFNSRVHGLTSSHRYPTASAPPQTLESRNKLPDRINYSINHQYDARWKAIGEVEWTHWSRLKLMTINYNNNFAPTTEPFFYHNTWRFALGTHYKHSSALTLKAGVSYEQSPTHKEHVSARVPDSRRIWAALGAKYKVNKNISLDAAYSHVFSKNLDISRKAVSASDLRTLYGNYKMSADLVGLQLTWNFV